MRITVKVLAVSATLALAPTPAAGAIDEDPVFPDVASNPANLVLRLVDLSRAYRVGNDNYCSPFFYYEEGLGAEQYQLDVKHPSYTCEVSFGNRGYAQWGRLEGVTSRTTVFSRLDSATLAYDEAAREGRLQRAPADPLGDVSVFRVSRIARAYPQATMTWRTGRVLSSVSASGASKVWVVRNLLRLARVQQARIESPAAVLPADNDPRSIPMFPPGIAAPIYWLGRTFRGPDLPERRLQFAEAGDPGYGPGWIANVDYSYISLGTWTRAGWTGFMKSRAGSRVLNGGPCGTTTRIPVRNGYATILSRRAEPAGPKGFTARRSNRCNWQSSGWRPIYMAYIRYRDHVVSVNIPQCAACVGGTLDRYDSLAGMRAIVRSVRQRGA